MSNVLSGKMRQRAPDLATSKCASFKYRILPEKLTKMEALSLSRLSMGRILRKAKLGSAKKLRVSKFRSRRDRREQEGMLLQLDRSR